MFKPNPLEGVSKNNMHKERRTVIPRLRRWTSQLISMSSKSGLSPVSLMLIGFLSVLTTWSLFLQHVWEKSPPT